MHDELARHRVEVVALSMDTPAKAAHHQQRDGLRFTLLSDPKLEVIRQFGLQHDGGLEFAISGSIAGIPIALPTGFKTMAIPTTLLVDEDGIVRWIDQADDYRLRGDVQRITAALDSAFTA